MEESAINQAHPDEKPEPDPADLFFGDEEEETAAPVEEAPDPKAFDPTKGEFAEPEADPTPPVESAGPTEPTPATHPVPEPEPEPEPDPTPDSSEQQSSETNGDAPAEAEAKKTSGNLERPYVVFHRLPLTEKALKFLLKEIEEGRAPEPRVAYFKIDRRVARNVNGAVGAAYKAKKDQLGDTADLATVSERAFHERHVEPRKVIAEDLSIT